MTLFSMRAACALLLAASLAACGGGSDKAKFPISGTVTGLVYPGLTLTADKQSVSVAPSVAPGPNSGTTADNVTYTFPQVLEYGDVYFIGLGTQPAHQTCTVEQLRADSAGHTASINVTVTCVVNSYSVNGYVTGLKGDGLQLINGSTSGTITLTKAIVDANAATEAAAKAAAAAATPPSTSYALTPSFTFNSLTKPVYYNQPYGVTILAQPAGQTCTVTNGSGLMQDAPVVNIAVNCVDNPS